jgi:hypothetical protein
MSGITNQKKKILKRGNQAITIKQMLIRSDGTQDHQSIKVLRPLEARSTERRGHL